jgi:hypothetical protein
LIPAPTKPEIDFPGGAAPTELVIEDLKQGDGVEAKAGDTISAHYVGVATPPARSSTPHGTAVRRWTSVLAWARSSRAGTTASSACWSAAVAS